MNYTIYLNGEKHQVTFNYIYSVGDLQAIILEKFKLKRQNVLSIIHENKILGRDYTFDESLIELNLFDITLHIIIDPEDESTGTKTIFYDWLISKYMPENLAEAHRQIMFSNILNNTWSSTAVNFMTEQNRSRRRNRNQQFSEETLLDSRRTFNNRPTSGTNRTSSNNNRATSSTNRQTSSTNRQSVRPPSRRATQSTSNQPSTSFSFSTSTSTSDSQVTDEQINQSVQDIFSAFMGMPLSSSSTSNSNPTGNLISNLFSLADGGEISFSTTTIPLGEGQNFWDILDNLQSVPVTLSQDLIDSLPTFKYNEIPSDIKGSDEESQDTCTVCMGNYESEDEVRVLLCKHYYHKECIDRWLSRENTRCPVCRHDNRDPHSVSGSASSLPPHTSRPSSNSGTTSNNRSTNELQDEMD